MKGYLGFLLSLSVLLVGCQGIEKNYDYYLKHPQEVQAAYVYCHRSTSTAYKATLDCQTVNTIYLELVQLQIQYRMNPQSIGRLILAEQQKLEKLQAKLQNPHVTPGEDQRRQWHKQQIKIRQHINLLYAVINLNTTDR